MNHAQNPIELQDLGQSTPQSVRPSNTLPVAPNHGFDAPSSTLNVATQLDNQPPRKVRLSSWEKVRKWWLEFAGALSSLIFLTAIVIFLAKIDGSKLDDWKFPWQIKPPTVLSILVTVCRINLAFLVAEGIGQLKWVFFEQREHRLSEFNTFDEATRGPWGALCFIYKINGRALVATFGALMAILLLAMDPFSQQVLYYATRTSNLTESVATLSSAPFYDSGALFAALNLDNKTASFDSEYTYRPPAANNGPVAFGTLAGRSATDGPPTSTGSSNSPASSAHRNTIRDESTGRVPQGTNSPKQSSHVQV